MREHDDSTQPRSDPRVGSEVYRPTGALKLRWRVWEVGPGNGHAATLEASGDALTRRGARRAVARAIGELHEGEPAQPGAWAAGPVHRSPRPKATAPRTLEMIKRDGALTSDAQGVERPVPAGQGSTSGEVGPTATEPDHRLASILARVEELQRNLAGVVEQLDASAEALDPSDQAEPPMQEPSRRVAGG